MIRLEEMSSKISRRTNWTLRMAALAGIDLQSRLLHKSNEQEEEPQFYADNEDIAKLQQFWVVQGRGTKLTELR